jgi:hypothetical protein
MAFGLPKKVVNEKDGAEMVLIPAGEFEMGSPKDDEKHWERPIHTVSEPQIRTVPTQAGHRANTLSATQHVFDQYTIRQIPSFSRMY